MTMIELVVLPQVFAWIGAVSIGITALGLGVLAYWIKRDGIPTEVELEPQRASVWHGVGEKPMKAGSLLLCDISGYHWIGGWDSTWEIWSERCKKQEIIKWAYLDEIIELTK